MSNIIELEDLSFQKLDKTGLKTLVDWARKEGWNPGKYDYDVFWETDPDGFYGFYNQNKLIAGGAIVSYNAEYGFMGLFIVHPEHRMHGIGKKLWYLRRDFLLNRLQSGATVGMDGVVDMQPFYQKGGFEIAFKDERYECVGRTCEVDNRVSETQQSDFSDIFKYDTNCFGVKRKTFLSGWLNIPNSKTFKYIENGVIKGYTVIRKADVGYKIGPLFANAEHIAEELYKACLNSAVGEQIYMDVPHINSNALRLVEKYKAVGVFECARMYHGPIPEVNMENIYGITSLELG